MHIYDWILMHTYVRLETRIKRIFFFKEIKPLLLFQGQGSEDCLLVTVRRKGFLCKTGLSPENGEIFLTSSINERVEAHQVLSETNIPWVCELLKAIALSPHLYCGWPQKPLLPLFSVQVLDLVTLVTLL